ncbi:hypothetical protein F441_02138 [Phytophthora nicotianae CJ01A1]|uniref:Uncharacterized protein n=1 Tax=Phytophthora nicotianae CJ01A1 TaxID=1317063 RepID=W2XRB3_PHYNI|nr:hypothetical protein F441_02138 [Phytophthora nicotianae CJ01A1]
MASSRGSHCAPDDDFDAALLLPEDSFEPAHEQGEHEVEAILDMQWKMRTSYPRIPGEARVRFRCKPENIVLALGARMIRILDDDIQEVWSDDSDGQVWMSWLK